MDLEEKFNPWNVTGFDDFLFYCCPECDSRTVTKSDFIQHAVNNHDRSEDFIRNFGCNYGATEPIIDDVKVESDDPEDSDFNTANQSGNDEIPPVKRAFVSVPTLSDAKIRKHTKVIKIRTKKNTPNTEYQDKSSGDSKPEEPSLTENGQLEFSEPKIEVNEDWNPDQTANNTELPKVSKESEPESSLPTITGTFCIAATSEKSEKSVETLNESKLGENIDVPVQTENSVQVIQPVKLQQEKSVQTDQVFPSKPLHQPKVVKVDAAQFQAILKKKQAKLAEERNSLANIKVLCEQHQSEETVQTAIETEQDEPVGQVEPIKPLKSVQTKAPSLTIYKRNDKLLCPEYKSCNETFDDLNDVMKHVQSHFTNQSFDAKIENFYKCDKCDDSFPKKAAFNRHLKYIHQDTRIYNCDQCEAKFTFKPDLTVHVINYHDGDGKKYKCPFPKCTYSFKSDAQLSQHIRFLHEPTKFSVKCDLCDKTFNAIGHLQQHINSSHEGIRMTYKCENCGKVFTQLSRCSDCSHLSNRIKIQYEVIVQRTDQLKANVQLPDDQEANEVQKDTNGSVASTNEQEKEEENLPLVEDMVEVEVPVHTLPIPEQNVDPNITVKRSVIDEEVVLISATETRKKVTQKKKSYKKQRYENPHIRYAELVHGRPKGDSIPQYFDKIIKQNKSTVVENDSNTEKSQSNKKLPLRPAQLQRIYEAAEYKCNKCMIPFASLWQLVSHQNVHKGESVRYNCEQCGQKFKSKNVFYQHMKSMHFDKVYKCEKCSKSFAEQRFLDRHLHNHFVKKHERILFLCDHCEKTFSKKFYLNQHVLKENTKSKSVNYELIFYSFRYENMDFEEDSETEGNFDPLDVKPKVGPSDFTDTVETPCHNSVNSSAFDSTPFEGS